MTKFVSKETVNRLLKDVKQIMANPLTENGIYYIHDDCDMLKGYALIVGPTETPYFGGYYFFELYYPQDYPHSPPKVVYCTNGEDIRFNPNLYKCGRVCISLLNTWRGEQWTSCQTISTILLTLCSLLCQNPLLNEPGVNLSHPDVLTYNEIIEYENLNVAVCDIINKKISSHIDFFEMFESFIIENFIKNCDRMIEIAKEKSITEFTEQKLLKTTFYQMNVKINYIKLIDKLLDCKNKIITT
jgi:ubiquitin-conjugating enzyme E2 Z